MKVLKRSGAERGEESINSPNHCKYPNESEFLTMYEISNMTQFVISIYEIEHLILYRIDILHM